MRRLLAGRVGGGRLIAPLAFTSAKSFSDLGRSRTRLSQLPTTQLRTLARDLEDRSLHSAVTLVINRAAMLQNVKDADSLRPQYEQMFNQCVVLLVSYFGSAVHGVFRAGVVHALRNRARVPVCDEKLTVSWLGLERAQGEREAVFADLLVSQKNISFQDMQSIARAFADLLEVSVIEPSTRTTSSWAMQRGMPSCMQVRLWTLACSINSGRPSRER